MSGEQWYKIVDRHGFVYPYGANKRDTIAAAKRWDRHLPDDAPHRVFWVTGEQVYP